RREREEQEHACQEDHAGASHVAVRNADLPGGSGLALRRRPASMPVEERLEYRFAHMEAGLPKLADHAFEVNQPTFGGAVENPEGPGQSNPASHRFSPAVVFETTTIRCRVS